MENIAKPANIKFGEGSEPNHGIITIEPCYPGYGTTLGNSLRRVLLSSLPGAAPVGVKIEGATHEFTTLPYIKEDILGIVLNLKKLRVKVHAEEEEEVALELNAAGEKQVTAGDISKDSRVEVVNPDLPIAKITDMAGSLKMEIRVAQGRGYKAVEAVEKKEKEAGVIDMDAAFSPILNVSMNVENVRVGKMTNWDKLILDIVTDGTITPKQAFEDATNILIEQFRSLIGGEAAEAPEAKESVPEEPEEAAEEEVAETKKGKTGKQQKKASEDKSGKKESGKTSSAGKSSKTSAGSAKKTADKKKK